MKRRNDDRFSNTDRKRMLWLVDNGYGIEAVMERYGLSEDAAMEYVDDQRRERRLLTDWDAAFTNYYKSVETRP